MAAKAVSHERALCWVRLSLFVPQWLRTHMQVYKALRHGAQPVAVKVLAVSAASLERRRNALAHSVLLPSVGSAALKLTALQCASLTTRAAPSVADGGRGAVPVPGGGLCAGDCAAARLPGPQRGRFPGEVGLVAMLCMLSPCCPCTGHGSVVVLHDNLAGAAAAARLAVPNASHQDELKALLVCNTPLPPLRREPASCPPAPC